MHRFVAGRRSLRQIDPHMQTAEPGIDPLFMPPAAEGVHRGGAPARPKARERAR